MMYKYLKYKQKYLSLKNKISNMKGGMYEEDPISQTDLLENRIQQNLITLKQQYASLIEQRANLVRDNIDIVYLYTSGSLINKQQYDAYLFLLNNIDIQLGTLNKEIKDREFEMSTIIPVSDILFERQEIIDKYESGRIVDWKDLLFALKYKVERGSSKFMYFITYLRGLSIDPNDIKFEQFNYIMDLSFEEKQKLFE